MRSSFFGEFSEFTQQIQNLLRERNGTVDVVIRTCTKNNGVEYTGVTIRETNSNIAPVIYLEPYYSRNLDNGKPILNEQTEECIQKLVDNKAQKEFMRYALLQEPKSALGKLVSEAWKKFKKWWDEKQRPEVEAEVRESVMGRLKELKQKTEVSKKVKVEPIKKKGIDR